MGEKEHPAGCGGRGLGPGVDVLRTLGRALGFDSGMWGDWAPGDWDWSTGLMVKISQLSLELTDPRDFLFRDGGL